MHLVTVPGTHMKRRQNWVDQSEVLGNGADWARSGAAAGLLVNKTPAGAIMQNGGGYGHVAIVESINQMNKYRW